MLGSRSSPIWVDITVEPSGRHTLIAAAPAARRLSKRLLSATAKKLPLAPVSAFIYLG